MPFEFSLSLSSCRNFALRSELGEGRRVKKVAASLTTH